jgi:hypothetical protein
MFSSTCWAEAKELPVKVFHQYFVPSCHMTGVQKCEFQLTGAQKCEFHSFNLLKQITPRNKENSGILKLQQ